VNIQGYFKGNMVIFELNTKMVKL